MTLDMRSLLNGHFLFRNLDAEVIDRITALGVRRKLEADQVLFLKGDPGNALFGVLSGRIRISTSDPQGKEIMLNIIDPGENVDLSGTSTAASSGTPRRVRTRLPAARSSRRDPARSRLPDDARARCARR